MNPKKKLFEQFARVAKSLASPNRLELLETLARGEKSVDALPQASGMSVANFRYWGIQAWSNRWRPSVR